MNCDTNHFTCEIQKFIDQCIYLNFLFLDGCGQGGCVEIQVVENDAGNTLCVVDRDFEDDFTQELAEMLSKKKLISERNEEYLTDPIPKRFRARIIGRNKKTNALMVVGEKRRRDV